MSGKKNNCYQFSGILNALCILISGVYGFVDIGYDRNNYLTNVIVNLSCIIFSFLFLYYELNSEPDISSYLNKSILFLFAGLLVLGTSQVGFILGFFVIFYSLINISFYYLENKKPNNNSTNELSQNGPYGREDSPPNPYRNSVPNTYTIPPSQTNNYDVNTINRNGNIIQYGETNI
jgi:ABC-type transport system involved in multi-copper enzyme maturation permease subunit